MPLWLRDHSPDRGDVTIAAFTDLHCLKYDVHLFEPLDSSDEVENGIN